jgi:hypothetical protein
MSIPIIGEKPEQPTYPRTQINVNPQGLVINIEFAPTLALTHVIGREDVKNLFAMWNNMLQNERMALQVVKHVQQTKL